MGKEYSFQHMLLAYWISTNKRMKLDLYLTPSTKLTQNAAKNLNDRVKTIKLLGENIGVKLCDLKLGGSFLDKIPKATKEKIRQN